MKRIRLVSILSLCLLAAGCATSFKVKPSQVAKYLSPEEIANIENEGRGNPDVELRKLYCGEMLIEYGTDIADALDKVSLKKSTLYRRAASTRSDLTEEEAGRAAKEPASYLYGEAATRAYQECFSQTDKLPVQGLALSLSGGGTRSASFSLGIMKALQADIGLSEVDAISSVSGGGYASYWFYMQKYYQYADGRSDSFWRAMGKKVLRNEESSFYEDLVKEIRSGSGRSLAKVCSEISANKPHGDADIFRTRSEARIDQTYYFQKHISDRSDIINYSRLEAAKSVEDAGLAATHFLIGVPLNLVFDEIFNVDLFNGSGFTNAYRKGIERTYGLSPNMSFNPNAGPDKEPNGEYRNGIYSDFLVWRENGKVEKISFPELRGFISINNACADIDTEGKFKRIPYPIINTSIAGEVRKRGDGRLAQSVFTFTPLNYGSQYAGHNDYNQRLSQLGMSKAIAISGAAFDKNALELDGMPGGVADLLNLNLGYDARSPWTQGSAWGVTSYWVRKVFPLRIDNWLLRQRPTTIRISDGGHSENLGLYSLIKRAPSHIIVVDAEQDGDYVFDALNKLRTALRREKNLRVECDGECPVALDFANEAHAALIPMVVKGFPDNREIKVAYVKLSIRKDRLDGEKCGESLAAIKESGGAYPCSVFRYYMKEREKPGSRYPHNSTVDIWYQGAQFEAYRDLGYFIGRTELVPYIKSRWALRELCIARRDREIYYRSLFPGRFDEAEMARRQSACGSGATAISAPEMTRPPQESKPEAPFVKGMRDLNRGLRHLLKW